ncbi:hypothetical protein D9M68_527480 [compost metagenome]
MFIVAPLQFLDEQMPIHSRRGRTIKIDMMNKLVNRVLPVNRRRKNKIYGRRNK